MINTLKKYFLILIVSLFCLSVHAKNKGQEKIYAEIERQLKTWKSEGRYDDIRIINTHKSTLTRQVKSGRVDLQAIVDEHNYKHKDGKFYGKTPPQRNADNKTKKETSSFKNRKKSSSKVKVKTDFKQKYQQVPQSNKPTDAYIYLDRRLSAGYPIEFVYTSKLIYAFPNGQYVYCANWDPRYFDPIESSLHTFNEKCKVNKEKPKAKKKAMPFKKGQTVDINFGNLKSVGMELEFSTGANFSRSTLVMDKSGRIAIGRFNSVIFSSEHYGTSNSKKKQALVGQYSLDGHILTIKTDDGQTHVGFISWSKLKDSNKIGHIYINGEHFWDRSK